MIELHAFPPAWGINPSPFCLKVETYLRLADLPFRLVPSVPFKAPKGKLPFIVDQGRRVADSGHIIAYLQSSYGDPLDHGLSAEQRALGHAIRRTCEESLYFVLLYARWMDEPGWSVTKRAFFGGVPPVVRDLLSRFVRRGIARSLHAQGYGWHGRDEIYALGMADLDALAILLGRRSFAIVEHPTSVDACVYSFLASVLRAPIEMPLKSYTLARQTLCAYVERVEAALAAAQHRAEPPRAT